MMTMVSLETRSLLLRPFAPSDVEPMLAMSQEDCARKWLPSQVYRDEAHAASAVSVRFSNSVDQPTNNDSPKNNRHSEEKDRVQIFSALQLSTPSFVEGT